MAIIWTYWHQGFTNAPYVVKECVRELLRLHPGATIHLLDASNVYDYAEKVPVPEAKWKQLQLPHQSDLLRTQLLVKYGGIWLDPTVFCLEPLEGWLDGNMDSGLFLFHRPGNDRIIANWFIAAEHNNYLLMRLYEALVEYWSTYDFRNLDKHDSALAKFMNRWLNGRSLMFSQFWLLPFFKKVLRIYPYMIYHFMFYHLIQSDLECRAIYDAMPKVSAEKPHSIQREGLLQPLTHKAKQIIDQKEAPLFKLKWNFGDGKIPAGSTLEYLMKH